MTGELQGGWEYVYAAYTITWIFFGGYAASLWVRRNAKSQALTSEPSQEQKGNNP